MLVKLRNRARFLVLAFQHIKYVYLWGMDIGKECRISSKAVLDRTNPKGVHIGDYSGLALGVVVLTHDFFRNRHVDTWIGQRCGVGANAIIYPGVRVGDGCIIAAGSVVTKDVPEGSIVAGNPARVIEQGIVTGKWGVRINDIPADRVDPNVLVKTSEIESA
jgi:acetyltransferase-like isoleucine patch superfamily enzyme